MITLPITLLNRDTILALAGYNNKTKLTDFFNKLEKIGLKIVSMNDVDLVVEFKVFRWRLDTPKTKLQHYKVIKFIVEQLAKDLNIDEFSVFCMIIDNTEIYEMIILTLQKLMEKTKEIKNVNR